MSTSELDLNALRETILKNQADGEELPTAPDRQILIDREGRIVITDPNSETETRELSTVHQGVFAATRD
jgi:hypothetical protein